MNINKLGIITTSIATAGLFAIAIALIPDKMIDETKGMPLSQQEIAYILADENRNGELDPDEALYLARELGLVSHEAPAHEKPDELLKYATSEMYTNFNKVHLKRNTNAD